MAGDDTDPEGTRIATVEDLQLATKAQLLNAVRSLFNDVLAIQEALVFQARRADVHADRLRELIKQVKALEEK